MKLYGLIGEKLSHSFSYAYFKEKFKKEGIINTYYNLYPLKSINEFCQMTNDSTELSGLNVTIPYKQSIIPFIDKLDDAAKAIGAVNTIKFVRDNSKLKLLGYNTDYLGFWDSFKPLLKKHHKKALILGTGGSAKAVSYALKIANINYLFVSRKKNGQKIISYNDLNEKLIKEHTIIINTTPLGMYPKISNYPDIPYNLISPEHIIYDLIYNPIKTEFLKFGESRGAIVKNGLEMLKNQADYSWNIWNDL